MNDFGDLTINDPSQSQYNKFNNPAIQNNQYDDRPITGKGAYEMPQDDIEFEDDLAEKQVAKGDTNLMDKVMEGFQNFFQKKLTNTKSSDFEESKNEQIMSQTTEMIILSEKKDYLRNLMSPEVFDHYYNYLYKKR